MRELVKDFLRICIETMPLSEPIYEFGSYQACGIYGDLRPMFPGKKYVGADCRPGPGVDVVLDLHHVNLPAESVGTVLLFETLEHVEYPREAINETHRILRDGGILLMSSCMDFPIHDNPYDFWRFTPEAFESLLRPFEVCVVESSGKPEFPHTVVGVGFKGKPPEALLSDLTSRLGGWRRQWRFGSMSGFAKTLTPPVIVDSYRRVKRSRQ